MCIKCWNILRQKSKYIHCTFFYLENVNVKERIRETGIESSENWKHGIKISKIEKMEKNMEFP